MDASFAHADSIAMYTVQAQQNIQDKHCLVFSTAAPLVLTVFRRRCIRQLERMWVELLFF